MSSVQQQLVSFDPRIATSDLPLTEAQREIWVSAVLDDDANRAFNLATHLSITGNFDPTRLRWAVSKLATMHDALRSVFAEDGATFNIVDGMQPEWQSIDAAEYSDAQCQELRRDAIDRPFDLASGPLARVLLLRTGERNYELLIVVHHIVCDGWSVRVLLDDLAALYNSKPADIEEQRPQFSQFALRNAYLESSDQKQASQAHWQQALSHLEEPSRLPPAKTRPPTRSYHAASRFESLDSQLAKDVGEFARTRGVSLFTVLLAAFSAWMSKIGSKSDVVAGVPVAGQPFFDMQQLVGHCANLLPFRSQVDAGQSFEDLLADIRATVADGYEHQVVTFGEILKSLDVRRDASMIPLVPVTLNVVSASVALNFIACETRRLPVEKRYGTFELALDIYRDGDNLQLEAIYNRDLYTPELIDTWLQAFSTLLRAGIANPAMPVADMPTVDTASFSKLLEQGSCDRPAYDLATPVAALVDRAAGLDERKTAVAAACGSMSYAELREFSNQFARYLKGRGVTVGDTVAVYMERNRFLPAIMLGVLKSGAAYLPIDPAFPQQRRDYMLSDSGTRLVVTQTSLANGMDPKVDVLDLDVQMTAIRNLSPEPLEIPVDPASCAYMIYTSGSTGNPKGVQVSHHNMCNFLHGMNERPGISRDDRVLASTSVSFDISVLELFLPLISGAALYVSSSRDAGNGAAIASLIDDFSLTVVQGTPSLWRLLIECGWQGEAGLKMLCGGEPLPPELIPELLPRGGELWNMYGPTETTVWSSCCRIEAASQPVPIGTAVANNRILILDDNLQPVPFGVTGEICIGGDGVAIGYHQRPELTQERFVDVPCPDGDTRRFYRTGDLGVLGSDGNLYHQGRIDFQVKLRGYRIEPGEIEARLTDHDDIEQAVVDVWKPEGQEPLLVAYLRAASKDAELSLAEIREYLVATLPAYMAPQQVEWRDEFPLTPNGKVDRKALQPVVVEVPRVVGNASLSPTENRIATIWGELVQGYLPTANDNFFDIGGHSLLAVRALAEIDRTMNVRVPTHLIALENLKEIAAYVDRHSEDRPSDEAESVVARLKRYLSLRFAAGVNET